MITDLNDRSREVFRRIVDSYLQTGDPVGSRTLSRQPGLDISAATIRNVMADLEDAGLLFSPHTSAGRLPTEIGLKLFVDGILEVGNLTREERQSIEGECKATGQSVEGILQNATQALSGLSHLTGLVVAPKSHAPLKHIEFVALSPGRALVVLVTENGVVENRIIEIPMTVLPSALVEATNYLSKRLVGRTLIDALDEIKAELTSHQAQLDALTSKVVEEGLAVWAGGASQSSLIVRGQANLLEDRDAAADLERIRALFEALETKESMARLIETTDTANGVQIFIGAENNLFGMSGCSLIVGPYRDTKERIIGTIGVIGPTRMNYARIIPMVDYTAKLVGRLIG
ncbi:heat-inducible transcriptional repressor HrcA [Magnetovibrio blakemorei]|uniref:Heat-inducible transcription repressor HrcA n=1 Tax=Magnetovibrio blakemorei TaxID=28181 RepID=A0A1E5Q3T0_9PROT|nr:heat-inducible transcriptional repressor HrcA [Magnetovibrio blakemorei]OEJ64391.1 heat-inducible transcriptional repressor HrcA [Magnetovibrio blakemorei]